MAVKVEAAKCTGCQACVPVCPVEAIKMDGEHAVIDEPTCIDCGVCVNECPSQAISQES